MREGRQRFASIIPVLGLRYRRNANEEMALMDPFHHEKRRRFTMLERAEFFAKANGHCEKCSRKIPFSDEWEIDHEIPLSLGGTNDDSNLQVLCSWCHDPKSDEDISKAAKSKRIYAQHVVPKKHQRSRAWRR